MNRVSTVVQSILTGIEAHSGMNALRDFGAELAAAPLAPPALALFLANTGEFFKEIPGGILALGLRICDEIIETDRFAAAFEAAQVLYSAVDEFGLHQLKRGVQRSHHQYFLDMAVGLGVSRAELLDPALLLPEATELAERTHLFYRYRNLGEGLGFHLASEISSDIEFALCLKALRAFPGSYGIAGAEEKIAFYLIHADVEPMHGRTSLAAVEAYLTRHPLAELSIKRGAAAFLQTYGRFFEALSRAVRSGSTALASVA